MPSNTKGGKGYKKKKKQANTDEPIFIDRQMGQMPARAIRLLGNRNVLCYSNDNVLRLCHICGKMKGRVFVDMGDIVLLSLRDFGEGTTRGDIVGKFPAEQHSSLRKEKGINPNLFLKLDIMKGVTVEAVGQDFKEFAEDTVNDAFEFDMSAVTDESDNENVIVDTVKKDTVDKSKTDGDVNIDDI
jgi:translation initiation factor 1A